MEKVTYTDDDNYATDFVFNMNTSKAYIGSLINPIQEEKVLVDIYEVELTEPLDTSICLPRPKWTLKSKADNLQNSSNNSLVQLCTPKRNSNPSRNSGTSCSNADSGVASQEEDEIESSSKDLETSDVDNKKEKEPYDNQYQIIDTNNEPMTSKETKR